MCGVLHWLYVVHTAQRTYKVGNAMANANTAATAATATVAAPTTAATVQGYRRLHPAGGTPNARASYGIAGVPGITVVDLGMFAGGVAPTVNGVHVGIVFAYVCPTTGALLPVAMATPQARGVAGVTSAVVAQAAATVAAATTGGVVATPATVAATAGKAAGKLVAAAVAGKAAGK